MSLPDLDDLYDELQRGKVYECSLRDPRWHLDGFKDGDCVYIDPRPSILESLCHELLHRLKPQWGERRVTAEARRLVGHMNEQDMRRWWAAYNRIKRKGRLLEIDDE